MQLTLAHNARLDILSYAKHQMVKDNSSVSGRRDGNVFFAHNESLYSNVELTDENTLLNQHYYTVFSSACRKEM